MRIIRLVLLVVVLVALALMAARMSRLTFDTGNDQIKPTADGLLLASSTSGNIVNHQYFSLSYVEAYEQPEWVAYTLTRKQLNTPRVPRTDYYYRDDAVDTRSADYRDYSGSGYTRGHLAPAGDMAFDTTAMRESFFMSNMSPQVAAFNHGVWRELEEQTRDWARRFKRLYIITGPVFSEGGMESIGRSGVAVPRAFYKVLLDLDEPELKGIGFVIPNALSDRPLSEYAVSIDSVEALTGLDFYQDVDVEKYESSFDLAQWKFHSERFRRRVDVWNRR